MLCQAPQENHMARVRKSEIEFLLKLKANQVPAPNKLTRGMGALIRSAREEKGWSQAQLAQRLSSRQSTVSDMEQGKNEIGVSTLALLAIVLSKPLSYFFPENLVKSLIAEAITPTQHEMLTFFQELELNGGADLALRQVKLLHKYFSDLAKSP
jgi:transcriptional regulator with XRE-family HTH domain